MKKRTLLKTIMIAIFAYAVLTWIIPAGYFQNGQYVETATKPVGLFDLIRYPIMAMSTPTFLLAAGVVLLTGVLYTVLNKTGVYQKFVEGIAKKYKNSKELFVAITCLVFITLSSLTGLDLLLFVMVPFFATILMLLGYGRFTAMLSTVGAILAGNIASTYGFNVAGYAAYLTDNINDAIWYRLGLFVLVMIALLFTVLKPATAKEKVSADKIMLYEKTDSKTKKSVTPMIIILSVCMVITLVGMFNWAEVFKINIFTEGYNNVKTFDLGINYPLFGNLLGSMYSYGSWTYYELNMMLVITIMIVALVYKVKCDDVIDSIKKGVKKMLPIVFYMILANTIFLILNVSTDGSTIFATIANAIFGLVKGFNGIIFGVVAFIGSFLFNDFPYLLLGQLNPSFTGYGSDLSLITVLTEGIHGLVQLIAPTGILLVIGLTYFDIPYFEWLKKAFKFILLALAAIIIVATLMILI